MPGWKSLILGVALLSVPATASADDFDDEPFSLRFPSALSRFSRYPDVAGTGGASAAAVWGSAPNPAATGWLTLPGTSTQYSLVDFANGTMVQVASLSHSFEIEGLGTIQPSLARAWSDAAETRIGPEFEFDATSGEIQWGRKVREDTALGLNLFATGSGLRFQAGPRSGTRSRSLQWGARAGVLHQVAKTLRAGAAVEYSTSGDRSTNFAAVTIPEAIRHESDTTGQFAFQPGVAWEYGACRRVYLDYKLGILHNRDGTLRVQRVLAGVDHEFVPFLNGRAGVSLDDRGNASPTLGIGVFPSESVFIDISWQRDMFPELRREFGRSTTIGIALSVTF